MPGWPGDARKLKSRIQRIHNISAIFQRELDVTGGIEYTEKTNVGGFQHYFMHTEKLVIF